jgi:hypothetical protein
MQTVTIPTMQKLIHNAAAKRRPASFWGPSGIGKSEGVAQAADQVGGHLCDIRVSQYESVDFRGIPDLANDSPVTVWRMPATLPFKGNPKFDQYKDVPIYLFLDEINQGSASVMSVCYQLMNDYRIGEHELMDNVSIITAGNQAKDKGVTNRYPAPLANRGQHFEVLPDITSWTRWASQRKMAAPLVGFLNFRDALLHTFDPKSAEPAFATPRTWGFAEQDFVDTSMPDDLKWVSIAGSVSDGPAAEFQAFVALMDDLPSIHKILANPDAVDIPDASDKQWAAATMISGHMKDDPKLPIFQKYLNRLAPEMVVVAWTLALARDEDLMDTSTFLFDYAPKYRQLF